MTTLVPPAVAQIATQTKGVNVTTDSTNLFKDNLGRWYTSALFWETAKDRSTALYTLYDHDREENGRVYPSLKRLFLEEEDPTEYLFAVKYLDSWKHWQKVSKMGTELGKVKVRDMIQEWREELEIKLRAKGLKAIAQKSTSDNGYQAAKFLAEAGWKAQTKSTKKVPKKVQDEVQEDFERLGLRRVK